MLDAVSQAKGPTEIGSLRDIQVFRGDSLVLRADLYDYLLQAGAGVYGQLQSGDQIFVPVCRQRVLVKGEVYRPAIYEINPNRPETLTRMLELGRRPHRLQSDGKKSSTVVMDDSGRRRVHYYSLSGNITGSWNRSLFA